MNRQVNTTRLNSIIDNSGMKRQHIASALGLARPRLSEKLHGRIYLYPDELINILSIVGWDSEQLANERLTDWYNSALSAPSDT
jgi:predicted XRE-type DNA-binding protein